LERAAPAPKEKLLFEVYGATRHRPQTAMIELTLKSGLALIEQRQP
jgi:hypothetical protein